MPFFVAEIKQFGGEQNAKLRAIKAALTGKVNVSKTTLSRKAKVKQNGGFSLKMQAGKGKRTVFDFRQSGSPIRFYYKKIKWVYHLFANRKALWCVFFILLFKIKHIHQNLSSKNR